MSSGRGFPGHRISKKLMLRVRPGVELVRASLEPTRELMTLDLPTLERPRKAISGKLGTGNCAASVAAAKNRRESSWSSLQRGKGFWQAVRRVDLHLTRTIYRRGDPSPRRRKRGGFGMTGRV